MIHMWHKAEGFINFDPTAGKAANKWWMIIQCPHDIVDYYEHQLERWANTKTNKPLFGSHISVIRGEEPADEYKTLWKQNQGRKIEFEYSHIVECSEEYCWLAVQSKDLEQIRSNFGLEPVPQFGFHLTIGKILW